MTPERLQRINAMLDQRQPDLTVCMEGVHKTHHARIYFFDLKTSVDDQLVSAHKSSAQQEHKQEPLDDRA